MLALLAVSHPLAACVGPGEEPGPDAPLDDDDSGADDDDSGADDDDSGADDDDDSAPFPDLPLGGHVTDAGAFFLVHAPAAERLEVCVFAEPFGADPPVVVPMEHEQGAWRAHVPRSELTAAGVDAVWYGLRAWGPNWPWQEGWTPGSELGFVADVDDGGHRFNPNKVLWDPRARELSHDTEHAGHSGWSPFVSGPHNRAVDTARIVPKGLALPVHEPVEDTRPGGALADQVIYEVHLRGLTMADEGLPEGVRGTFAGAALRAPDLAELGVTAVEFLPVFETQNDQNDLTPESVEGDNYWGYSTLNFFSPDRRYAADRSPGGPTAEFRAMVEAFHQHGIAVYLDVVHNHTGEGGPWDEAGDIAPLFSWRGLDNPGYYELTGDGRGYVDNNGVGPNINAASAQGRDLVIDSLRYWDELGVDGFRFDLASVLGNACDRDCFSFDAGDPDGILRRATEELDGAVLIAEPWGIGAGTYQPGGFPHGWAEWNDGFRDDLRADQNRLGEVDVTPGWLANRFSGSWDLFGDDGRQPDASINYLVSHDGLTLADLYSCNDRVNDQEWPWGPSDGGTEHNLSWDQGGDPAQQQQAARTGMALLLLSAGVPMFTGGDEFLRSQRCNNNPYNLDSPGTWLSPTGPQDEAAFHTFVRRAIQFRHDHPSLRPAAWREVQDADGDGQPLITWYGAGGEADWAYLDDPANHYLGFRLDADEQQPDDVASIFVGYNGWIEGLDVLVPAPAAGRSWYLVADTHPWLADGWLPAGEEALLEPDETYLLGARSVVVLVER